jgi:NAD-dependent dihydropyrimidine dehydrogenase PreA subunit
MSKVNVLPERGRGRVPIDIVTKKAPRGKVHVIEERCKECKFCIEFCPCEVLELSDHYNIKGYKIPRIKAGKENDCSACRFCEEVCPEYAIFIEVT